MNCSVKHHSPQLEKLFCRFRHILQLQLQSGFNGSPIPFPILEHSTYPSPSKHSVNEGGVGGRITEGQIFGDISLPCKPFPVRELCLETIPVQ